MKKILTILVTLSILLGAVTIPTIMAAEGDAPTFNTSTPLWIYDYSVGGLENAYSMANGIETVLNDGYTTFKAMDGDPHVYFNSAPDMMPVDAQFLLVEYRTTEAVKGEIFAGRDTNSVLGTSGTNEQWRWNADGQWHADTVEMTIWNGVAADDALTSFRFDPLEQIVGDNPAKVTIGATVDVKYLAFFKTAEDAAKFNLAEYQKKLAWEEEQAKAEEEANKKTEWPDPEFKEMETVEKDLNIGTMKYTPSADGKEMTISYEVAGETISYTVPNNYNYISGGYAGTDDLSRPLYSSEDVGSYEAGKKYIGLFYFLWHGEHGDSGIFDMQKIIDELGIDGADNVDCGKYGSVGAMHFFAEPLYGYYYANDTWVMRKHVELLTNANVDFLYFDVTNGYAYLHNALKLMEILHEFNEQGYDAPQVVFYTHSSADSVVKQLYSSVYSEKANKFPDTWFCIDGKPVVIAPDNIQINNTTKITDVFTVKREQWPNDPNLNANAWPWMDFEWPQRIFTDSEGKPSAVSVSIAQHSGTVCFSHSSLYNNATNRGRSYVNEEGYAHTDRKYNQTLTKSYKAWKEDPNLTMYGLNFQAQFDYAIESEAEFILVTGWNEWVAQRQNGDNGQIIFIDTASMEFSRDAEMMRGGYFDNYYMQLIYNIQKAKGTAPVIVQDNRKPINVTGDFDQWNDIVVEYKDPVGDTVNRDATGFGHKKLTNETGRNDIVASKVVSDTKNLYFYAKTVDDVTMFDKTSSWMQLYINSDADASTGWYGYDYIVNYAAKDTFTTTVAKYNGENNTFSFEEIGDVSYRAKDNELMIAVPQELLGIENYYEIEIEFKWADSTTNYDEMEDFYCDGDVAPLGRLNYVYQNYIEGKSVPPAEETEPEVTETEPEVTETEPALTETEAETPVETVPDTDGQTETDIETNPAPEGCSSVIVTASTATLVALAAAAVVLRKKD